MGEQMSEQQDQRGYIPWMAQERGDVPGWVLVAVMSAGLVTTLWLVADEQLSTLLRQALESVAQ